MNGYFKWITKCWYCSSWVAAHKSYKGVQLLVGYDLGGMESDIYIRTQPILYL
jgi:hypothetical protein